MRPECRDLTDAEVEDQHPLYMAASLPPHPYRKPVDVGRLLYCGVHRRPLIECHDERNPPNAPISDR